MPCRIPIRSSTAPPPRLTSPIARLPRHLPASAPIPASTCRSAPWLPAAKPPAATISPTRRRPLTRRPIRDPGQRTTAPATCRTPAGCAMAPRAGRSGTILFGKRLPYQHGPGIPAVCRPVRLLPRQAPRQRRPCRHQAVASLANLCNACHNGAGSGTPRHGLRGFASVSTAIARTYAAKSGAGSVTEVGGIVTCRNVSCHGGIVTRPGSAPPSTSPPSAHSATPPAPPSRTPQYNSYYSGKHQKHLTAPISLQCWNCHDPTRLATTHFSGLDTPAFTNPPGSLFPEVNYINGRCTPNPATGSLGVTQCHDPGDPGPFTW